MYAIRSYYAMIAGSLASGTLYEIAIRLPFLVAALANVTALVLLFFFFRLVAALLVAGVAAWMLMRQQEPPAGGVPEDTVSSQYPDGGADGLDGAYDDRNNFV